MSSLNHSGEESSECPLCMEPLEMDDLSFYPCTCGYQICRFCWHRIRTDENGLCPACRKAYPENPADFKPLSTQEMHRIKAEKRQKDQQKKQKATESRKHLANVRVVQRNLVFVVGLSPRLADPEVLKRHEYFGKLGKIHKVVINHSTQYAGSQGPSASAYVTYIRGEDALRAIQSVNNISVDGRTLRASLGTTKYCSHFMKNQLCPKPDCMYLHEIGDEAASFTKEEMQQGKHTDYERLLHEQLLSPCSNHKENRKASASPPPTKEGASNAASSGPKDGWPSLPPGVSTVANSSSLNTSGKNPSAVKTEPPLAKEKNGKVKGKAQPPSNHVPGTAVQPEESSVPQTKTNGSNRKTKEKPAVPVASTTTAPVVTQPTKPERQRSTSLSPVLSTSSNPTPPLISSSSSPSSSQDSGFLPSNPHQFEILKQGASMAAEEEEIDRARDEAEDFDTPGSKVIANSSSFAQSILDTNNSSNSHSFFSTGPLPAFTARSNGTSPAGCWLANGAEEESMTSSLPNQSAADWQLAFNDISSTSRLGTNLSSIEEASSQPLKNTDDELGFDPFHETQKALAEMLEKESISSLPNGSAFGNSSLGYSGPVQSLYSNPPVPPSMTRHSPSFSSLGLGLGLGVGVAQQPQPTRTRIPPPGFNPSQHLTGSMNQSGVNHFGLSLPNINSNRPSNQLDLGTSKMLPFMNNQSGLNGSANGPSGGYGPRLYHDSSSMGLGMSGIGVGSMNSVGMASNMSGYVGGQNGSLSHMPGNKPQGYNAGVGGSNMPYSNGSNSLGLGPSNIGEPAPTIKDWQDGLRALFPNVNISMGNGGGVNNSNSSANSSGNSRLGAFPPGLAGMGNGQQPMHHQHHQQQQQHQMPHQPNPLANKGWRSNISDWTSIDPAIVSSGQITDSRSDSPPHWLRSLEQLTESGNSPAQQQPSNPSNLFGLANTTHYTLPSLVGRSNVTPASGIDGLNSMGSFWPPSVSHTTPSMPPPGFSHIRPTPKTAATAETHKLDSKSSHNHASSLRSF